MDIDPNNIFEIGTGFGVIGIALMIVNKVIDRLPVFRNGHNPVDSKITESLEAVTRSNEKIAEIIAGPYSRREDGTFRIHNLPETELHARETREIVGQLDTKLKEITGG